MDSLVKKKIKNKCFFVYRQSGQKKRMIVLFNPEPHVSYFKELVQAFMSALCDLRIVCETKNCLSVEERVATTPLQLEQFSKNVYILYGAQAVNYPFNTRLNYFIFNYEQANSQFMKWPWYLTLLKHSKGVLDYSDYNIARCSSSIYTEIIAPVPIPNSAPTSVINHVSNSAINPAVNPSIVPNSSLTNNSVIKLGGNEDKNSEQVKEEIINKQRTFFVPYGFHKCLQDERLLLRNTMSQPTDILLYGTMHERRSKCISELKAVGINAKMICGVYGEALVKELLQTKIVLNIHFYQPSVLEQSRITPLIANKIMVISEPSCDIVIHRLYKDCVVFTPITNMVETCKRYLADADLRTRFVDNALTSFKLRCSYIDVIQQSGILHAFAPFIN